MRILMTSVVVALVLSFATGIRAQEISPEKSALYTKYYELKNGGEEGQKQAYEVAKEYLQKFGNDDDQYTQAVKKFVPAYEKLMREVPFYKAYNAKEYAKAFELGKQILAVDPENFQVLANMVRAAYFNAFNGNNSLNNDAAELAKKGLAMIESGKVTKPDPFANIDDATGFLNHVFGQFSYEKTPGEAEKALLKAASIGSTKTEPTSYYYLANAILKGQYDPLSAEYQEKFVGKPETPEGKAMFEKLIATGNRAVDAFARAVALSTKPENAKFKAKVMAELTDLYKALHNNSDAGLNELIAGVLSKPMPQ